MTTARTISRPQLADSVVSLWPSKQVKFEGDEFKLATIGFGKALNLCPGSTPVRLRHRTSQELFPEPVNSLLF